MKSKRLLILLLLALFVPWAAMAQTTSVFSDGFEDMTSAEYLTTNGYFTYSDASCNFTFTTDYHGSGEGNNKALYANSWSGSSGCTQILGLPILANQINGLQIAFTYYASSSSITLGYLTADDKSTFVNLQTYSSNSSMTSVGPYDLSAVPETATRIALKFNSYWNFYVDDINVSLLPTCPKPTLSSTVATTNTTATVSWTPSGDNQQLFDLYWSTSSTAPTAATTPSVANYEGNSYEFNFADLNPSSTYYVWVRGNCGTATNPDVSGGWTTSSASFETPCETITDLPWTVDFEDMTANTVPQCWDNSASTTSDVTNNPQYVWGVYSYSSSNKVLRMYNYLVHTGTALINTPSITLPANSEYLLYFDYAHDASCGAFKVKISEDGGTTFVEKGSYTNNSGTFTAATPIDLSSYAGKTIIVQFFANANYGNGAIYVDNVRVDLPTPTITKVVSASPLSTTVTWTGTSSATGYVYQYKLQDATEWGQEHAVGNSVLSADITTVADGQYDFRLKAQYGTNYSSWVTTQFTAPGYCMVPSDLVITNVTWSQAELSWTEEFGDGEWTLLYKTSLEEEYTTYGTVTASDMPVTLPGLNVNTTYNVKIYPNCDATKFITDQFTTKCEPITEPSWEENFESYDATTYSYYSGHSYDLTASCWKNEHISGAGSYLFQISSYSSTTGNTTKKLVLPDMTSGTMTKLCLPGFMIPTGTNYQFSLDVYRNTSGTNYGEGIRVFASTNGEIEGATELAFISRSYATAYTIGGNIIIPAESASGWYSYELPIGFDGVCYIILRGESLYGSSTYMDNFAIEPVPTCHRPRNLAYTPASLTNHSVTLTWIPGSEDQSEWQIVYNNRNFDPNVAGFEPNPDSTITVTDTCYTFNKTLQPSTTYYAYVRANCGDGDLSKWSKVFKFTTKEAAPAPTNFQKTDVGPDYALLTWKAGGGDFEANYDLYVVQSATTPATPTIDTVPTVAGITELPTAENPYLLDGLDNEKRYYAWVRANHVRPDTTIHSAWVAISDRYFTTLVNCPIPTTANATNVTPHTATLNWIGYSEAYNVRYRTAEYENPSFSEDFEKGIPATWTCIANGTTPTAAPNGWTTSTYSGSTVAVSLSWVSGEGDFDADNWLITPLINLQDMLKFDVRDYVTSGSYQDYYEVRLSTTGNAIDDFTVVLSEMASPSASWTEFSYDLSSYAGQQGYIAIHHQASGAYYIMIDNFRISTTIPAGDWNYSANNPIEALTTDIEGLDDDTDYEWQVQATCAIDPENDWSPLSAIFHTPSVCTVPVADSAINITYNSADLYWTGYQDEYNVRYRHYVKNTQPATVILTAGNIWGDGTGYQMLLDADATAYGTIIPTNGGLTASGDASAETYAEFEYKIPINADGAMTTQNIVLDSSIRIQIPAGIYDWCITNPTPDDRIWIASNVGNVPGRYDDFEFMPGATYEFTIVTDGQNDGVFLTATYPWSEWTTIDESITTTNYELGGLDDETIYEWQVKGLGECTEGTDWSEGDYFETLPLPTQTIALTKGSNWVSYNVEITLNDLKAALVAALPNDTITIKSKTQTHTYNPRTHRWSGSFNTLFNLANMNIISVTSDGEITLQGAPIDPAEHPITINAGSNYLAFPLNTSMTPTNAFAGFAKNGDKVKSKNNTILYNRNKWNNNIPTLEPGQGYIYVGAENEGDGRTFVYPSIPVRDVQETVQTPKMHIFPDASKAISKAMPMSKIDKSKRVSVSSMKVLDKKINNQK